MSEDSKHIPIKSWSEDDQPREKLLSHGKKALTDAELIAILIRSGVRGESALSLAKRLLSHFNHDLYKMGKAHLSELIQFKGMGEAKSLSLIAALELGRRREHKEEKPVKKLTCSQDCYKHIAARVQDLPFEEFWIILVNQSLKPLKDIRISTGSISATLVDNRIVLKHAIDHLATGIFLVHNHPSGNLKPSRQDIQLTKKLREAAALIDIKIHDHLIISDDGYFSFADQCMF